MSQNTVEWYPANVDIKRLAFTYEFAPESQKTFRVVRCRDCTHVFCSPIPKGIHKNYKDVIDQEYLRHSQTRNLSAKEVLNLIKRYVSSGTLLDVGCATGDFLSVAKDFGYSSEGLELSRWSSKIARNRGFRVYQEGLQSLSRKFPGKYDVITLLGVIEHFESPAKEMKYLNSLLKPNGFLVIWTGDVNGLMSRLLGRRWWYWQGQHIQYFSSLSLNCLARNSGFAHIVTKRYPIPATYEQMENSLSRYEFHNIASAIIKPFFALKPIWYLRLSGEMLWIGKKRKR